MDLEKNVKEYVKKKIKKKLIIIVRLLKPN